MHWGTVFMPHNAEKRIIVTGAAGFIGYHVCTRLLAQGNTVWGLDDFNPYYAVSLKQARFGLLETHPAFHGCHQDITDKPALQRLMESVAPKAVIHLAAQAGVRYSIENPDAYTASNLVGFMNILEGVRHSGTKHLIYASSSSVYGANRKTPYAVHQAVDHPVSLYAATKKSNELLAHAYASLYDIPMTGLRFFTVYGPWGRPDMAYYEFTRRIIAGEPITLNNQGMMKRDFTYIDDVVEGIVRLIAHPPACNPGWDAEEPNAATSYAPWAIHNIGNSQPVDLFTFVSELERVIGQKAVVQFADMQAGDVLETSADCTSLYQLTGFTPRTSLAEGLDLFVRWYRTYYGV